MKRNALMAFLAVLIFAVSCVDPFNLKITTRKEILIIEGSISDSDSIQSVVIKKNIPSSTNLKFVPVSGALVEVTENATTKYLCLESGEGTYFLPPGFKGKVNGEYQLRVKLSEGKEYLSTVEKLNPVPEIKRVFSKFMPKGLKKDEVNVDGHFIYLDTRDLPEEGNFYAWESKSYERQYYCFTCEGGLYNRTPLPAGSCTGYEYLRRQNAIYDYACEGDCWDIFRNEEVNVMSDRLANGAEIQNRLVAKIPYYHDLGTLIEITQKSLTNTAFLYLDLVADQSQNTGSLADTPPAALVGNIRNVNDKFENVGGFFMVSGVRRSLFWLDRKDAVGKDVKSIGLLGRMATMEPPNAQRPPTAFCIESFSRTNKKPKGWLN